LVSLPSGAGVVRLDDGSILVTNDASGGGSGSYLREDDRFHPVKSWVNEDHCVVGGLLPHRAVSAEVVDDRGSRVGATVSQGAYAAVLDQPNDGYQPIVCFRDTAGDLVRRPWPNDYPSALVTDAEEPCPACGAIDYVEYTPFEEWRGGRGRPEGTIVPNPVVSCRVCGHDEPEGTFLRSKSFHDGEDEATGAARLAVTRATQLNRMWHSAARTLRQTRFPIYAVDGSFAQLGGSGSSNEETTEITIKHYNTAPADPFAGAPPRLLVTTKRDDFHARRPLSEAREALESWVLADAPEPWPDASHAALTLWLRARDRKRRAVVLDAARSEQPIIIDGSPTTALMLETPGGQWVAVTRHAGLTIIVAAHDVEPTSLRLQPIADPPAQLLGPEPPLQWPIGSGQ
jgi:hypothetical protein